MGHGKSPENGAPFSARPQPHRRRSGDVRATPFPRRASGDGNYVPTAAAHPATQPLAATITAELAPDSTLVRRNLLVDGVLTHRASVIPAPLPVGTLTLRAQVTDSFGHIGQSDPVVVRVVPELKLRGRQPGPEGHEQWQLEAAPEFQPLVLETGDAFGSVAAAARMAPHAGEPWANGHRASRHGGALPAARAGE